MATVGHDATTTTSTMGGTDSRPTATRHVCVARDGTIYGKECTYCTNKAYEYIVANDGSQRSFYRCHSCRRKHPDWYCAGYGRTCPYYECKICGTQAPPPPKRDENGATLGLALMMAVIGGLKNHDINNPRP
jgi:hypothetical protein